MAKRKRINGADKPLNGNLLVFTIPSRLDHSKEVLCYTWDPHTNGAEWYKAPTAINRCSWTAWTLTEPARAAKWLLANGWHQDDLRVNMKPLQPGRVDDAGTTYIGQRKIPQEWRKFPKVKKVLDLMGHIKRTEFDRRQLGLW